MAFHEPRPGLCSPGGDSGAIVGRREGPGDLGGAEVWPLRCVSVNSRLGCRRPVWERLQEEGHSAAAAAAAAAVALPRCRRPSSVSCYRRLCQPATRAVLCGHNECASAAHMHSHNRISAQRHAKQITSTLRRSLFCSFDALEKIKPVSETRSLYQHTHTQTHTAEQNNVLQ